MDIYYFNELGEYDKYNPSFYLDRKSAKDIIKYIGKSPYKYSIDDLYVLMNLTKEEIKSIIDGLILIDALTEKDGKLKVNFPTFYEDDIKLLTELINKYIINITYKLKTSLNELNYDKETLYHLVCNDVFDNYAFDYLVDKDVITNNKNNIGNRNYIIIGYEKSEFIDNYSNKLLCSNNRYNCGKITFNSFGDTNGFRNDFFRYFRLKQMNLILSKDIDNFYKLNNEDEEIFKKKLENTVLNNDIDKVAIDLLNKLDYYKDNIINVPIIKKKEHLKFSKELMNLIYEDIKNIFLNIININITPNINEVPYKDTANEIWHIIFGLVNEELIKEGIVSKPISYIGEGRYLKCIYIEE